MLTDSQREIVLGLAENDMNLSETARATHFSHSNIDYQCQRIKKVTGLSPKRFYDLRELVKVARKEIPVETVVRCRDCRYLLTVPTDYGREMMLCWRIPTNILTDDFFCAYGEKREEGVNQE